jgi:hypothetical protein
MKKIKLWFKCRYWYSGLYDSIIKNIRMRTDDSEFVYRFFRFKYNQVKREYDECKIL